MQEALEAYQRVYRQYDASSINDIPVEVFYKELARYQPLVNNAKEAFADPKTGMAPGVMGLAAEDMQNFYSQLPKRLELSLIHIYTVHAEHILIFHVTAIAPFQHEDRQMVGAVLQKLRYIELALSLIHIWPCRTQRSAGNNR